MTRHVRIILLFLAVSVALAVWFMKPDGTAPELETETRREPLTMSEQAVHGAEQPMLETPDDPTRPRRQQMVEVQLRGRDIIDERVLHAMEAVPRHLFVSRFYQGAAYADRPQPIGHGQTISQP